jgi:hypothetical protein
MEYADDTGHVRTAHHMNSVRVQASQNTQAKHGSGGIGSIGYYKSCVLS